MRPQILASCANCWFNGLQYGSIGLSVGYCTEHKLVLRRSEDLTCRRHMRKDFLLHSARVFQLHHQRAFSEDKVVVMATGNAPGNGEFTEESPAFIRNDSVGDIVADYGEYDTKIESLAQLRTLRTFRSEFAMLSLGRAYTDRCIKRGGSWASGIHLLWWIKRRMLDLEVYEPTPSDFRYSAAGSLQRQVDLAEWSLLMLRLTFISDLGVHSQGAADSVESLQEVAEQAALETEIPNKRKLLSWIKRKGNSFLEDAMPESRYRAITAKLLKEPSQTQQGA